MPDQLSGRDGKSFKKEDAKNTKAWWQPALLLFAKLSVWIAVPIIIGAFLGKWLDKKYSSEPWLFLFCTGFAFLVSMFGLIKNTIEEYKKIEKEALDKTLPKDKKS